LSRLGTFLEVGVRTNNILESLEFYRALGFSEREIGDVWTHKYTVVSDGVLCIGLHDRDGDSPAITFVQQNLAKRARKMADHGFEFNCMRLGEDVFNELRLGDRDGHAITMLEARTFSGGDEFDNDSVCGSWLELSLPVRDVIRAARFWAAVAPSVLRMREEPATHMRFDAGGIAVGLSENIALEQPSMCFRCQDREKLFAVIEKHALEHEKLPAYEDAFVAIKAPEGTTLYAFDEDFLGAPYEVAESDDISGFPG
jgi:hypothetical protein